MIFVEKPPSSRSCEQHRVLAALRSDGELAPFELALLHGHVLECARCRAYGADIESITAAIRRSPAEPLVRRIVIERHPTWSAPGLRRVAQAAPLGLMLLVLPPGLSEQPSPQPVSQRGVTNEHAFYAQPPDDEDRLPRLAGKSCGTRRITVISGRDADQRPLDRGADGESSAV